MKLSFTSALLSVLVLGVTAKDQGTFSVLRFNNEKGQFSTEGRMDPIISPGSASQHAHGVMGGSNFGVNVVGDVLLGSRCTNALIANDRSNYWVPKLYFQSPVNGTFKRVPLFYMSVYYKFDATNDEIRSFPPGLKMVSGNALQRTPPIDGGLQLDPARGDIQAVQWTCPTQDHDKQRWPLNSDGTKAGMQDPNNKGSGAGFPVVNCDAFASPLRQDVHMPSCYNPEAGLGNYQNNMRFPSDAGNGKTDCPEGWLHLPHLFYEVYFDTLIFANDWDEDGQNQPFVSASGDRTGYGAHADYLAGWDEDTLQIIIDTCNTGSDGMDKCPQVLGGLNGDTCLIESVFPDDDEGWLEKLPGNNPLTGWGA